MYRPAPSEQACLRLLGPPSSPWRLLYPPKRLLYRRHPAGTPPAGLPFFCLKRGLADDHALDAGRVTQHGSLQAGDGEQVCDRRSLLVPHFHSQEST